MQTPAAERESVQDLVRQAAAGSRDAFAELVRRHQDAAYLAACRALGNRDLAMDVTQEAFLAAFTGLHRLTDPQRFSGWLRGIVRHVASDALRELDQVRCLAERLRDQSPTSNESAEFLGGSEQREHVRTAIARLDAPHRSAIDLHYRQGWSYEQIAAHLGVSKGAVLGRLQRARRELKKELTMENASGPQLPADFAQQIIRLLEMTAAHGAERELAIEELSQMGDPAVQRLCDALDDNRSAVRLAAARALCRIGDPRALGPVLRLLYARHGLAELLRAGRVLAIPGFRDELLAMLAPDTDAHLRSCAIDALGCADGDDQVVFDALANLLHDPQRPGKERLHAMSAMCDLRPQLGCELVTQALSDPALRRLSGGGWWEAGRRRYKLPLTLLRSGLQRDIPANNRLAAAHLMLRHSKAGEDLLRQLIIDGSPDERAAAALALAPQGDQRSFEALVAELQHGYEEKKWTRIVTRALTRQFATQLQSWAAAHPTEVARSPRLQWCLAQIGAAEADPLQHGTPSSRAAALRQRARHSEAASLPEIRQCLREGRPAKLAREALHQLLDLRDRAEPMVRDMLSSQHWQERKAAVCALRRWGKLDQSLCDIALRDVHPAVRACAIPSRSIPTPQSSG